VPNLTVVRWEGEKIDLEIIFFEMLGAARRFGISVLFRVRYTEYICSVMQRKKNQSCKNNVPVYENGVCSTESGVVLLFSTEMPLYYLVR